MENPEINPHIYAAIVRYYRKFTYRNGDKKTCFPNKENIQIINMYLRNTIFSNNTENIVKKMAVIQFYYKNESEHDVISLNLSFEDYSDLLHIV